jgi:hypothetical protein
MPLHALKDGLTGVLTHRCTLCAESAHGQGEEQQRETGKLLATAPWERRRSGGQPSINLMGLVGGEPRLRAQARGGGASGPKRRYINGIGTVLERERAFEGSVIG